MSSTHSRTVSVTVAALAILTSLAGSHRPAGAETALEVVQRFRPYGNVNLTIGSDGNVYGTAITSDRSKTAFRIDGAGTFTTLHTFANFGWIGVDAPGQRLVVGRDGALYGTTPTYDGSTPKGEFFRLDNDGNYTLLYNFYIVVGSNLIPGQDGAFYGPLGVDNCAIGNCRGGDIFRIDSVGNFTSLTGENPFTPPMPSVIGSDGALYGTRLFYFFGSEQSIFRVDTVSGQYTDLRTFTPSEGFVSPALILGGDGLIYGVMGCEKVVRFDATGTFTMLHEFTGPEGKCPVSPLTLGSDGAVYGVNQYGGAALGGTVFKIHAAGIVTTLHSFDLIHGPPNQPLSVGKDGALYGTTWGYAFRLDSAGTLTWFPLNTNEIGSPSSPLVHADDCALYGVAEQFQDALVYRVFEAGQLCQRITFDPLPDRTLRDPAFTLSASASSGLPVSFTASGRCTLSGDQVFLKRGVGICRVTAYQAGDSRFLPAEDLTQEFRVGPPRRMRRLR